MDLQPTLADDLILLRPLRESDFEELYQVAKDPLIWEQHPCNDRNKLSVFTTFFSDSIQSKGVLIIIDRSTHQVFGSSRFKLIDKVETAVEIGWSFLARDYWGGVYNRSMKTLMMDYAFGFVQDVIFYIGKDNIRSQKAVEKLGGERIITPRFKHLIKKSESDWTYRINKEDWNKRV